MFKKGNHDKAEIYWPISLTPILSEGIDRLLQKQMVLYLSENNLISENQFWFRQRSSIIDALLKFTDEIKIIIDKNLYTSTAFLDLSKAFDSVSPKVLLRKLENLVFEKS